jgi:hypothetical protein
MTMPELHKIRPAKTFHDKMVKYLEEYQEYLLLVKSNGTAISHYTILHQFINYILNHHLVCGFDQITVSMTNSKFLADFKRHNKEVIDKETMKKIIKGFFVFLYGKHGVKNEKVMRGLEKQTK